MAKQLYKKFFFVLMVFMSVYPVSGQELSLNQVNSGWNLAAVNGEVVVTRNGKRTVLYNNSSDSQGLLMGAGDMVQTEKGFAELHLQNASEDYAGAILRFSENTSVLFGESDKEIFLDMLYGRLRVESSLALTIRIGNSSAFFRECDAIIEYIARPGTSQPALAIHCLDGEGELTSSAVSEAEGSKLPIRKSESLSLDYRVPFTYVERKNLDESALGPQPETSAAESYRYTGPSGEYRDNSRSKRAGILIMGLVFIGAGAAMQGYRYFGNPGPEIKDALFYGSFGSLGLGAVFLFGAVLYKPQPRPAAR